MRFLVICLLLHAAVILVHVALVIIWSVRLEHRVWFALSRSGTISTSIVVSSQIIGTVSTKIIITLLAITVPSQDSPVSILQNINTALVTTTQSLALRTILTKNQTITAAHDQHKAWNGLGSALSAAWNQLQLPASIFGTLSIATYLLYISILHVSVTSMFGLEFVDHPNGGTTFTTIGMPDFPLNTS